ncbi:MAG: 6-phosphofructokinase, partial [Candidatus Micrarchaeota archaeon]|nr:6-phosphofructokinase [Candidatus Micrarchaeota archaeon]
SAALNVTDRVYSLKKSTDSQSGGLFIEVTMGRNSGFLAASAGLAPYGPRSGADLIYLPERNFVADHFRADVENVLGMRMGQGVVVVSEGIREIDPVKYPDKGYKLISKIAAEQNHWEMESDPNLKEERMSQGHRDLALYLGRMVKDSLGKMLGPDFRVRDHSTGYDARSGRLISSVDAAEAEAVGRQGVLYFLRYGKEKSGSVAIRRTGQSHTYAITFDFVPLEEMAAGPKKMPELYIDSYGKGVTDSFIQYAGPLIGPVPQYQNEFFLPAGWDAYRLNDFVQFQD